MSKEDTRSLDCSSFHVPQERAQVVDVNAVQPSKSFLEAMASERQDLAKHPG